jgi:hypothetical protein
MGRPKGMIRQVAEAVGVDSATVRRSLMNAGIADADSTGFDRCVEIVKAGADPARVVGHAATRVSSNPAMTEARLRFEGLKARKLEIENEQLERSLISRVAVVETATRIVAEARTAILSLGYRVADKCVGLTDAREIARIVESEARIVLGALADDETLVRIVDHEAMS